MFPPVTIIEPDVMAEHAHQDVEEAGGQVRERPQVGPWRGARGPEAVARKSTRYSEDNLNVSLKFIRYFINDQGPGWQGHVLRLSKALPIPEEHFLLAVFYIWPEI